MTTHTPEARELALVEKVELRIALADTDAKFQSTLNTYLPPLLLKLASDHVAVRNKVIAVCQHINKRIAPENIQLPVATLLKQFKDHPASQLIRHFDLSYAQHGLPRLSSPDRADLFPLLVSGIASLASASASHAAAIFNLFLRCLVERSFPPRGSPEDERLRSDLALHKDDAAFLSSWIGKLLVFRQSTTQSNPFLSGDELDFLTLQRKPDVWDPSTPTGLHLTNTKVAALKFISSGAFNDEERLLPALYASADPNSRLSDTGEGLVKQAIGRVSVEDTTLVQSLFQVYERSAAMLPLRIKILTLLSKSKASTSYSTEIIRLVNQGLVENLDRADREVTKLRTAIIQYLGFVARNASKNSITAIASNVVETLKDFLDQQHADTHTLEMRSLRGSCFEAVGLLASLDVKALLEPELSKLRWLFRCLADETDKEVVFSIDSAISSTIKPFERSRDLDIKEALRNLLVDTLTLDSVNPRNTQFACLRFANRCLPFNDATARWIDIAAAGAASSDSHEIIDEARKGLDPYWHQLLSENAEEENASDAPTAAYIKAPDFTDIATFIFQSQKAELNSSNKIHAAVTFCRRCLFWSCLYGRGYINTDVDWERKQDLAVSSDQESRKAVRRAFATTAEDSSAQSAILLLFENAMKGLTTDAKARPEFASVLLELASFSPDVVIQLFAPSANLLLPAIMSNDVETRRLAAQTFGVLGSHPAAQAATSAATISGLVETVQGHKTAVGAQANKSHGCMLALGFLVSRQSLRKVALSLSVAQLLTLILDIVENSTDQMLQSAAFSSLSQLIMFGTVTKADLSNVKFIDSVIEQVSKSAKVGNEKAIAALGHCAMLFDDEEDRSALSTVLDNICALHELRQAETQFAVGEALTCLAFDWDSTALLAHVDVDATSVATKGRKVQSTITIGRVLQDSRTTKPSLKKAAVIWLLCLLQFGSEREEVQSRLPQFQASFKRCLSDRDELVQESASRGLGLVYEKGDRSLKDSLVRDLVASFTSNKTETSGTVTEDTQLFEPGQLPTGDGSITTYKDIMSLASEVGDSSLVYRFMSLASNNAIWSSRAAFGRFGLSNVLSDSSVDGYLATNPKLYPKLYRYRFDPNTNVRRSMNDIWNALVKDPARILESHFDAILEDLLHSIVGREWRARQASCAAVADLVQGRTLDRLQPYIDRIWSLCFKVLDDIKDSVRGAAAELARVLTNILLRNLEGSEGKEQAIQQLLRSVLEFLLSTSGLESSAKEVQGFSLHTLLEMIKKGKPQNLRPFVPDLVVQLLGYLSTFEPEAVNYVALNASNYNLQQSDIDDMRLKSIRGSPLMEAIERCLDMLDEGAMAVLAPKMQDTLRSAVGVPSKVGYSRVLVTLSTRCNFVFRPYADGQLIAVQKRIIDRNETVSSSYAAALGYVARLATEEQLIKTVAFAKQLYFGEDATDRARFVAGEMMQAMARSATDRYNSIAAETFPFVFFGRFDDDERVRNVFKETYGETVSGSRAVALYLDETAKLAQAHLDSKKWTLKHAGGLAMAEMVSSLASSYGSLSETQANCVWPGLRKALGEKSWDGKEKVLGGLVMFVEKGGNYLDARPEERKEIVKIAVREAKRRNEHYQGAALACLGKIAAGLPAGEMDFTAAWEIAQPLVDQAIEAGSQASDGGPEKPQVPDQNVVGAVEAVMGCIKARVVQPPALLPDAVQQQQAGLINSCAKQTLDLARRALAIDQSVVQSGILALVKQLCDTLQQAPNHHVLEAAPALPLSLAALLATDPSMAQEKMRTLRADALNAFATALSAASLDPPAQLATLLSRLLSVEKSPLIRSTLTQAQTRLNAITPST